jgi:hypothetical protein
MLFSEVSPEHPKLIPGLRCDTPRIPRAFGCFSALRSRAREDRLPILRGDFPPGRW